MSLTDFLVTYLAIGSAFAMRGYFANRHRSPMHLFRAVTVELFLWLPALSFRSFRRLTTPVESLGFREAADRDAIFDSRIDEFVEQLDSKTVRIRVRELLERYVALRSAIAESGSPPNGHFELFAISGHRNGGSGTACLYRRNLEKLNRHADRAANDLVKLFTGGSEVIRTNSYLKSQLLEVFAAFDDELAIASMQQNHADRNSVLEPVPASIETARFG